MKSSSNLKHEECISKFANEIIGQLISVKIRLIDAIDECHQDPTLLKVARYVATVMFKEITQNLCTIKKSSWAELLRVDESSTIISIQTSCDDVIKKLVTAFPPTSVEDLEGTVSNDFPSLAEARAKFVAISVVDKNGGLIFSEEDVPQILQMDCDTLDRIWCASASLNNFGSHSESSDLPAQIQKEHTGNSPTQLISDVLSIYDKSLADMRSHIFKVANIGRIPRESENENNSIDRQNSDKESESKKNTGEIFPEQEPQETTKDDPRNGMTAEAVRQEGSQYRFRKDEMSKYLGYDSNKTVTEIIKDLNLKNADRGIKNVTYSIEEVTPIFNCIAESTDRSDESRKRARIFLEDPTSNAREYFTNREKHLEHLESESQRLINKVR